MNRIFRIINGVLLWIGLIMAGSGLDTENYYITVYGLMLFASCILIDNVLREL